MPSIKQPAVSKPRYFVVPKDQPVIDNLKGQIGFSDLKLAEQAAVRQHLQHAMSFTVIQMRPVAYTEDGL